MSRRPTSEDLGVGSDSFLDVIANIVGILIILIVLAGMRVSNMPVVNPQETATVEPPRAIATSVKPEIVENPPVSKPTSVPPQVTQIETQIPEPELIEPPVPVEPAGPTDEVKQAIAHLEGEITKLKKTQSAVNSRLNKQEASVSDVQRDLRKAIATVDDENQRWQAAQQEIAEMDESLKASRSELRRLRVDIDKAEQQEPKVKILKHALTPVGHTVSGKEIHFRLKFNRVSVVPLDQLVGRMKDQIRRQKDWLIKYRRHEGHVGPVAGYSMSYRVERTALSVIDELRFGRGMMQIGISKWEIEPETTLRTESAESALKRTSKFYRELLAAEPKSTLTFWVYPDSFKLYRRLQQFAQLEGFTVAARPLPDGVAIAGSPNGTRSVGQ